MSQDKLLNLDQVVEEWGIAEDEDDHRRCVRWLGDQIRARKIPAHKIRRRLLMNQADRDAALKVFQTVSVPVESDETVVPRRGLSVASMRRRSA